MDLKEYFLKQKQALRPRTMQAASLVRLEQLAWQPAPGALSAGELLRHLWSSEQGVRRVALEGDFTYYEKRIPGGLPAVLGDAPRVLADELAQLERVHRETLAAVEAFPAERFEEERAHAGIGFRRKIGIILLGINEHEIHHRAQLMTYLRILGTPVPEVVAGRETKR